MEDPSNPPSWGIKLLAPLSTIPSEAGYRGKWDRASDVQTIDWGAVCITTHILPFLPALK